MAGKLRIGALHFSSSSCSHLARQGSSQHRLALQVELLLLMVGRQRRSKEIWFVTGRKERSKEIGSVTTLSTTFLMGQILTHLMAPRLCTWWPTITYIALYMFVINLIIYFKYWFGVFELLMWSASGDFFFPFFFFFLSVQITSHWSCWDQVIAMGRADDYLARYRRCFIGLGWISKFPP